jgi:hypothetical protein
MPTSLFWPIKWFTPPFTISRKNSFIIFESELKFYHKLVTVCSRVNLCNNRTIFWLSETTKTLLGFALYTLGISFQTDTFQRVCKCDRDRLRPIWDYNNNFATVNLTDLDLKSEMTISDSILTTFQASFNFWGSCGNWHELKIEPL